ncbi:MAG: sulfite exporter TauE/SafE family protein [Eubacteriales bacterium]|nr:sulfite exporter TauE/SafE family protein [Eubacteriales bacterium]
MQKIIYFLIALFATGLGSMTGAAGGVIMKPLIDLISEYDTVTIGLLTGITLVAMGLVNLGGHIRNKRRIDLRFLLFLTPGAVAGGIAGGAVLNTLSGMIRDTSLKAVQNVVILILMGISFLYIHYKERFPGPAIRQGAFILFIGLLLGMVSAFLGIGGGPINVSVILFFFAIRPRDAAMYSIIVIEFAQIAKLAAFASETGFGGFDLRMLPAMILGGVLGGFAGAQLNRRVSERRILIIFNAIQVFVILACVLNILGVMH